MRGGPTVATLADAAAGTRDACLLACLLVPQIDPSVAAYVDAYVAGWALSRRTTSPEPVEHGWHVLTGTETEPERYVLTGGDAEDIRRVMRAMPRSGSHVKFAGDRDDWLILADAEWEVDPTGWFMAYDPRPQMQRPSGTAPDGRPDHGDD